ncbi:MAG: VOC family protein [Paracoccaceae bacterium]
MTQSTHGCPCWYELATSDLTAAQAFYAATLGWTVVDSGMPGMDYRLAQIDGSMIAGMMQSQAEQPQAWTIYFAVDDCDKTFAQATELGATGLTQPADIPNTGRFALLTDPEGAKFGILQPLPMDGQGGAFNQSKTGFGNWNELLATDPAGALDFYRQLFGWTLSRSVEMGPDMTYHIIAWNGTDIGGVFAPMQGMGGSRWRPYFGIRSATTAATEVPKSGGKVLRGPDEVPGGALTLQILDPQGIELALVGPS